MTTEPDYAWALPIAVERLNAEYKARFGSDTRCWNANSYGNSYVITVAKLIAKYEQPHVDPVEVAAARALNAWCSETQSIEGWKSLCPTKFLRAAQAMREILAEVTRACPIPHTPNSETIEAMREILARGVKP